VTAPDDSERLHTCLRNILPRVDVNEVALTGGIAIQRHLASAGIRETGRTAADVDFVATSLDAISPAISDHFLISHFHTPHPGYDKFMVQVVDPGSHLRIDVFADVKGSVRNARRMAVAGHQVLVLDARAILRHKVELLRRASAARPVDEKHLVDARVLAAMLGEEIEAVPQSHLTKEVYGCDLAPCPRCDASRTADFPLAAKQQLFDILGYT
jgi:hypothetical protein